MNFDPRMGGGGAVAQTPGPALKHAFAQRIEKAVCRYSRARRNGKQCDGLAFAAWDRMPALSNNPSRMVGKAHAQIFAVSLKQRPIDELMAQSSTQSAGDP